jgi:hypothetical protein
MCDGHGLLAVVLTGDIIKSLDIPPRYIDTEVSGEEKRACVHIVPVPHLLHNVEKINSQQQFAAFPKLSRQAAKDLTGQMKGSTMATS